ncbi:IS110 family transposase [Arthrobacter sp. I2-34]|uniref:IS110 family transposase n=1 Tax=Arthrobacter hankyongi TaxID=2904801 RepID=A0ABS9L4A9_9MICC|nr:IS110 family transposase [Arthrobacter hankyongi]MCG2621505.1 IS110 family transposase [Arthrobacter hankyongi]
MFERTSVGLDVHARSIAACALDSTTGEIIRQTLAPDDVTAWLERLPGPIAVTYEAGPTGFWLARTLAGAGIECQVAAPSRLLRAPGDRVKTDKRDAMSLARMLRLGEIVPVRVPTADQEAMRDLCRAHAAAVKDLTHARQRINAMLLRQGAVYPEASHWTRAHSAWLGRQHFDHPAAQAVFESLLEAESLAVQRRKRLDKLVASAAADCEYTPVINALTCLRGIDTAAGFGLAAEIGDWTRFTGATIGSYLGLVPSEDSSGQTRRQGAITKAGNSHARWLLAEAAWIHRRPYRRPGVRLLKQWELVDPATRIRAQEGNQRLHRRWEAFDARNKASTKANTAVARELAGWCWSLAVPLQQGAAMKAA